jgi:hypothetical protein
MSIVKSTKCHRSKPQALKPQTLKPWRRRKIFRGNINFCILEIANQKEWEILVEYRNVQFAQKDASNGRSKRKAMRDYWEERFVDDARERKRLLKQRQTIEVLREQMRRKALTPAPPRNLDVKGGYYAMLSKAQYAP